MRRRATSSHSAKEYLPITNQKLDRIVFPSAQEYRGNFENHLKQKGKMDKQVYLKLLRSLEEEILQNLAKLKLEDKESDFLLIRAAGQSSPNNEAKVLFWKNFYNVGYALNGKTFTLPYNQYEELSQIMEVKNEIMGNLKEIFKNAVKYCVHLKEKSKSLDHNLSQFVVLANYKKKELEKVEKQFQKISTSKKYANKAKK